MDRYLDDNNVLDRLLREFCTHGEIIVAYDFDNTVFDFHNDGDMYFDVVLLLKKLKKYAKLIVFTASKEGRYEFISNYLLTNEIPYDTINEDIINAGARKIYYNILLDDRAGLSSAYKTLNKFLDTIEKEN